MKETNLDEESTDEVARGVDGVIETAQFVDKTDLVRKKKWAGDDLRFRQDGNIEQGQRWEQMRSLTWRIE